MKMGRMGKMSINFFTGTPGSGKSLHMAMIIDKWLRSGKNVIANFEINEDSFARFDEKHPGRRGIFIYVPNSEWLTSVYKPSMDGRRRVPPPSGLYPYIEGLYGYAEQFHERNYKGQMIEKQTLLVLDECQDLFNPRSWNRKDRLSWCSFFREHRKYGYEVYLISQDETVIDKQIRNVLQFEYTHRYVNTYKLSGRLMGFFYGGKCFVFVKKLRGVKKSNAKIRAKYFSGQQKYYDFYDSYKTFGRESAAALAAADNHPEGAVTT